MLTHTFTRRTVLGAALTVPVGLVADCWAADAPVRLAAPMRCADLLDTIGVNTHLRYDKSQYNAVDAVQAALAYCGITHVRDTAISAGAPNAGHYSRLARAGIRYCLVWGTGRTMADAISQISALEAGHPDCVEWLEGPNEIQPKFAYAGQIGLAAGQRFMTDMKAAATADPHLSAKKLVSFTSFAPAASIADYANHHPYPKNGAQPAELIRLRHDQWVGPSGAMPGKPMVFTEFGYHTLVGRAARPGHWQGVSEDCQAILVVNGLLDAAATGVSRTYIYQLFDGMRDRPEHVTQENHFGLFDSFGQPKPAATAIRTLGALLGDTTPNARGFQVAPFAGRIAANLAINALPLADGKGRSWLALWQEPKVWDDAAMLRADTPTASVTLTLPHGTECAIHTLTAAAKPAEIQRGPVIRMLLDAEPLLVRIG